MPSHYTDFDDSKAMSAPTPAYENEIHEFLAMQVERLDSQEQKALAILEDAQRGARRAEHEARAAHRALAVYLEALRDAGPTVEPMSALRPSKY